MIKMNTVQKKQFQSHFSSSPRELIFFNEADGVL